MFLYLSFFLSCYSSTAVECEWKTASQGERGSRDVIPRTSGAALMRKRSPSNPYAIRVAGRPGLFRERDECTIDVYPVRKRAFLPHLSLPVAIPHEVSCLNEGFTMLACVGERCKPDAASLRRNCMWPRLLALTCICTVFFGTILLSNVNEWTQAACLGPAFRGRMVFEMPARVICGRDRHCQPT